MANNLISTYDILTSGDFLDCDAYFFINKWWDVETPKIPRLNFFEELKSDIGNEDPQYFRLAKFKCRRYKTNQLLTSISREGINWLKRPNATVYFKEDNSVYWVRNVERINDGRLIISLEEDWIATDWGSVGEIEGLYVFDTIPLSLEQIKEIKDSCFLCPSGGNGDEYATPSIPSNHPEYRQEEVGFRMEGRYTIVHMRSDQGRRQSSGKFNRQFFGDCFVDRELVINSLQDYDLNNVVASFVLPQGCEKTNASGNSFEAPYDAIDNPRAENFITQRYLTLNFNTEHFLKHHGRYLVKSLGEKLGEVKGIGVNYLGQNDYYNDNFRVNFNVGMVGWDIIVVIRNNVFIKSFFISAAKNPKDEKTVNWLSVIGRTILAGVSIAGAAAVGIASGGTAAIPAGAMAVGATVRAGQAWKEAFAKNEVSHSADASDISTFISQKAEYHLLEIEPQIPQNFYNDYIFKVNWHIQNDYFPLNDESIQLTPNIGVFSGRGIGVFGDLWGWVKLSDKCVVDGHGNRVLELLRKKNVFIYGKEAPNKKFLNWGGFVERPFDWSPRGWSVDTSWTTTYTTTHRQMIRSEQTYVWTYVDINGRREQWRNGTTRTITIGQGDTFGTAYQRWNPNETTNYNVQAGDTITFRPTAGGGQVVEQYRNVVQTHTQTHTTPTMRNYTPSRIPTPQAGVGINPFNRWGDNPPTSSLGKGGTPPPLI